MDIKVLQAKRIKAGSKKSHQEITELEANAIRKILPVSSYTIAMEPTGRPLTSEDLARTITDIETMGHRDLVFIIGGPFGLAASLVTQCNQRLSLSPMTFTHDMARLILAEQIYRACTIRAGLPYHH